jgi:hypothetical protein
MSEESIKELVTGLAFHFPFFFVFVFSLDDVISLALYDR